jgi:non-homologous end joining protein Ku
MTKKPAGPLLQVKVRMTPAMRTRLEREADRNGQTLNAEILARIAQSFESRKELEASLAEVRSLIAELQQTITVRRREQAEAQADIARMVDEAKKHLAQQLSEQQPADVVLDTFEDEYEKALRKLMNERFSKAEVRRHKAETSDD